VQCRFISTFLLKFSADLCRRP